MSVWLTIPSARPATEIAARIQLWQKQGYRIALWRNGPHVSDPLRVCNACGSALFIAADPAKCQECGSQDSRTLLTNRDALKATPDYAGWGASINGLIREIMRYDPAAEWFVGGGDDTDPDPNHTADEIAADCRNHFFLNHKCSEGCCLSDDTASIFGVMQPTGDRWGADEPWAIQRWPDAPAYIDRICGSPWIGREFARRANQGIGPFRPEYPHMFADEELQEVARKLGVLWQRRDLIHMHHHPRRDGVARTPSFAQEIYSSEHWAAGQALFNMRKEAGFPGSEPLA